MSEANVLIVYRTSDNRIVHAREQMFGFPRINELETVHHGSSTAIFDAATMDYLVGITYYDEGDFDDEGNLTAAAITKYEIRAGEESKYVQDLLIAVPTAERCDDLVFASGTGEITESLLPDANKEPYLVLTIDDVDGHVERGVDTYTGNLLLSLPSSPGNSYIELLIKKFDHGGNAMVAAGDNDKVWIKTTRGKINQERWKFLANGEATVRIFLPNESVPVTFEVHAAELQTPGQALQPGSLTIQLDGAV